MVNENALTKIELTEIKEGMPSCIRDNKGAMGPTNYGMQRRQLEGTSSLNIEALVLIAGFIKSSKTLGDCAIL